MATWAFVEEKNIGTHPKQVSSILQVMKQSKLELSMAEICAKTSYAPSGVRSLLYKLQRAGAVRMVALDDRRTVDLDSLVQFESVKRWIRNLKEGPGRKSALYNFHRFLNYVRANSNYENPDQLIDAALDATVRELSKHVDLALGYAESLKDVDRATREKHYNTVRSFYFHNRAALPESPLNHHDEITVSAKPGPEESLMLLSDVKKAVSHSKCGVLARAVVLCVVQAGLDDSTLANVFNFFAYPQLVKHFGTEEWQNWTPDKCPVRIDILRPKEDVRYFTFLDVDAISSLKDWLNLRYTLTGKRISEHDGRKQNRLPSSDPIFIVGGERPLQAYYVSNIFRELGFDAGINVRPAEKLERYRGAVRRYRFHSHECRDLMKSLARPCGVDEPVIEFFLGHSIDRYGYDKSPWSNPEFYREQYQKMRVFLNVLSSDPEKVNLKEELDKASKERESLANEYYVKSKRLEEEIASIREQQEVRDQALQLYLSKPTRRPLSSFIDDVRKEREKQRSY